MKDSENVLEAFHDAAKEHGLEYLLIGGFAVSYWGIPRFTADVDYVISANSYDLAVQVLAALNYRLAFLHPKKSFAHFENANRVGFRIDLMIVNDETWVKLQADGSSADLGGKESYPVVSAKHLIAMKFHATKQLDRTDVYKDLNDVAQIMLAQDITMAILESEGIIDKYGTEKTVSQLRTILEGKRKDRNKPG